jgi:hypothetical protein
MCEVTETMWSLLLSVRYVRGPLYFLYAALRELLLILLN